MMRVNLVVVRGNRCIIHNRNKVWFWTGPSAAGRMVVLMVVLVLVFPMGGICSVHIFLFSKEKEGRKVRWSKFDTKRRGEGERGFLLT